MMMDSPTITIKQDPEVLQEEQDDLILSYLNSDYVTTETTTTTSSESTLNDPPSPPYSTSSVSTDAAPSSMDVDLDFSMDQTSSLYAQDPFLLHLQTALNEQGLSFPWPTSTTPLPGGGTQDPSCLMNLSPLFTPSTSHLSFLSQPSLYQPQYTSDSQEQLVSSPGSSYSTGSDGEQSKKKRGGRKKREVSIAPAPSKPLTRILPAKQPPISLSPPTPPSTTAQEDHHVVKQETSVTSSLDQIPSASAFNRPQHTTPDKSPAEMAYAKRQERLIKNRAAALLSRKRKREHLTTLEEERQLLANENQSLHSKVSSLEARVVSLEQENMELKRKLSSSVGSTHKQPHHHHTSLATPKHAKTTGMVFMIILFSFALFTLPTSHSSDQLTVGGGSAKPIIPLIGSSVPEIRLDIVGNPATEPAVDTSSSSSSPSPSPSLNTNMTTDLMLIDHVQAGDLQTWIEEKLIKQTQVDREPNSLVQWRDGNASSTHLYLYADRFSRVAPMTEETTNTMKPTLSILCPLNQTASPCDRPSYLQIDVQVIGSRVIEGELKHIEHHRQEQDQQEEDNDDTTMLDSLLSKLDQSDIDRRRHIRQLRKKTIEGASRFSRVVLE